jgi:uncharacterized membrane protein YciS (DUF1049 family)
MATTTTSETSRSSGFGRVLVVVYGILAIAATGRSVVQIALNFSEAPVAYSLSALAAVVYIVATIALIVPGPVWYRVALVTIGFELLGVLTVGTLSVIYPDLFPEKAVWSFFGRGYWFVPLVLPIVGLVWLWLRRPRKAQ